MIEFTKFHTDEKEDAEIIYDLLMKHHNTPEHVLPTVDEILEGDTQYYILQDDDELIGLSAFRAFSNTVAEQRHTFIVEEHRRKGHGASLNKRMEQLMKKQGIQKIICFIYVWNKANICLKIKNDFVFEGKLNDPGEDEYYILGKIIDDG